MMTCDTTRVRCGQWMRSASQTAVLAFAGSLLAAPPAAAQTATTGTAHIVEWDLPAEADASPGAMMVDSQGYDKDRLFFVTRLGTPRVFRMNPWKSPMKGSAQWTSWELSEDSFTTGGLRRLKASHDRRWLVVRTANSIQRVDTQSCSNGSCPRAEYLDQVGQTNVSDLGIDDLNNIFTAGFDSAAPTTSNYIQKLTPGATPANMASTTTTVTRWPVGGGAGFCADLGRTTTSFPCLSGIFVLPSNRNLVYYSETTGTDGMGNIAELNIATNAIRRWRLSALTPPDPQAGPVQQPRQLIIDRKNIIWVVTGSGHLVSLNPSTNQMRVHTIPMGLASDPFGIAPDDDLVGYTDSGRNMVGMLVPQGPTFTVTPDPGSATPTTPPAITVMGELSTMTSGAVPPVGKVVVATTFTKSDGVFVEAQLDSNGNDDLSPLGITANKGRGQGTFFYAVGFNSVGANRIGFIRMKKPHGMKMKNPRDDDDPDDGLEPQNQPAGWHMSNTDDADDDGLPDAQDTVNFEEVVVGDDTALQPGESVNYSMTASSTTLALVAVATGTNALGYLEVDIYNALGVLVATSPMTPGVGIASVALPPPGQYTVTVKNLAATPTTQTPTLITRAPWQQ